MDFTTIIITVIGTIFGGGLGSFVTIRTQKKKAAAEAESTELDNVEKAITIWREMAQQLKTELEQSGTRYVEVAQQVDELRKEVNKLTAASNKILKMLDKITHDNLEKVVEQIKNEINGKIA